MEDTQTTNDNRMMCHVRYGSMHISGLFVHKPNPNAEEQSAKLRLGKKAIIKTSRGIELGEVITKPEPYDGSEVGKTGGEIIRATTRADVDYEKQIVDEIQPKESVFCRQKIKDHNLPMKLAYVEHLFGGDRVIFYFLADGRIDFRELVKDLAREYRTRIEMKQIGVRDEARLLADCEHCGRGLCCKTFMRNLDPVTMKMAKLQKTTLDPAKISGRCGRLMCCLRFEDPVYTDLKKKLPKKGTIVTTAKSTGEVISTNVLKQLVTIETENERILEIKVDEILSVKPKKRSATPEKGNNEKGNNDK